MKLPPGVEKSFARFDQISLRERALIAGALITALVMGWDAAMMRPLHIRETAASQQLKALQESTDALQEALAADGVDPTAQALQQERSLHAALGAANSGLASASAGLIPPERMVEVIHDVLSRQRGVRLVSLRNQPVASLASPGETQSAAITGPYVHPLELTIEGGYLDVLAYLEALEALPWRLYWKVLELETLEHPLNRVRIELSTLSMDKAWMGV